MRENTRKMKKQIISVETMIYMISMYLFDYYYQIRSFLEKEDLNL
jgi:hypothetical protein